jgi:hypothetical protein
MIARRGAAGAKWSRSRSRRDSMSCLLMPFLASPGRAGDRGTNLGTAGRVGDRGTSLGTAGRVWGPPDGPATSGQAGDRGTGRGPPDGPTRSTTAGIEQTEGRRRAKRKYAKNGIAREWCFRRPAVTDVGPAWPGENRILAQRKPDPGPAKYAKNGIAMETLFRLPEAGREAVEPARLKRDDQAIRVNDRCPLPFAG